MEDSTNDRIDFPEFISDLARYWVNCIYKEEDPKTSKFKNRKARITICPLKIPEEFRQQKDDKESSFYIISHYEGDYNEWDEVPVYSDKDGWMNFPFSKLVKYTIENDLEGI